MNYIVYLAYGGADYCNEAIYAVLSFYKHNNDSNIKIVIYTDNLSYFKELQLLNEVIFIPLSVSDLKDWIGPAGFNHRLKIKTLQHACKHFSGNILYCDTDTHFNQNVSHLFTLIKAGTILFHENEGTLASRKGNVARKMRTFFKKNPEFKITSEEDILHFDSSLKIWNAGVIGFNTQYSTELDKVLELTDAFCTKGNIFVLEQVAFNYYFQQLSSPYSAVKEIEHYWYFKEFRSVLRHFFATYKNLTLHELIERLDIISPYKLSAEKRAYKSMGFWEKQWTKLSKGKKWRIMPYKL